MFPEFIFAKLGYKRPQFLKKSQKMAPESAMRDSNPCKIKTNGPRDLKLGLKWSLEYHLGDQRCCPIFFPKFRVQMASNFHKGPKKWLRSPVCRYSKPCKMQTNDPRDPQIGPKMIPRVSSLWSKMFSDDFFFAKIRVQIA